MFNQFSGIVAVQDAYLGLFRSLADADQKAFYQTIMVGPFIDEAARLRQIAFDKATGEIEGVEARHWFAMQTGKIDLLKKVEDRLAADLMVRAEQLRNQARLALLLALALVVIALLFAFVSIRAIKRPLDQVVQVADQIAGGDLASTFENRFHDEIGQLLRAMQTMQGSLRKTVGEVFTATDTVSAAACLLYTSRCV